MSPFWFNLVILATYYYANLLIIMIDFIKIVIRDPRLISSLWNNPLIEYYAEEGKRISIDEIREKEIRKLKNLIFTKHHNCIEITGSIHYYFNNGLHNANDFTVQDCINTIIELKNILDLDLKKCRIVNLEFGVNIIPPLSTKDLITSLKYHERNEFRYYPSLKYAKQSSSFNKDNQVNQYKIIKAYAKGLQRFKGYDHPEANLFRFEVKSKRSKYYNKFGIVTLHDLLNKNVYNRLSDELIKEWSNVLVLDKITAFSNQNKVSKYLSSDFWENTLQGHRNSFTHHKKRYHQLIESNPENIYNSIRKLIIDKVHQLKKYCAISPTIEGIQIVQFHKYIRGEYAQLLTNERKCIVTGLNIDMQKDESHLLSHTGLKYYYDNDLETFEKIKNRFLSDRWRHDDFQLQIKEMAHNIRNRMNNLKLKQNRLYPSGQCHLFF